MGREGIAGGAGAEGMAEVFSTIFTISNEGGGGFEFEETEYEQ
jgi:hypothetical protein